MNLAAIHTGRLLRLFWLQERSQFQYLLFNAFLLPATMCYMGLRVAGDTRADQVWWIAGAVTTGLGMGAVSQTGFAILQDRFNGRLAILRSAPIPKLAYYTAHVAVALGESIVLVLTALALFQVLGLAAWTFPAAVAGVLAAVCAGSALGGLGAALATRATDFHRGGNAIALAGFALSFVSPVFWDASGFPLLVRAVTWLSPFTHVAALMRAVIGGHELPLSALAGTVGLAVVFNLVSYRLVRWQE